MAKSVLFAACLFFTGLASPARSQEGLLDRDRNAIAAVEKAVADYLAHHAKVSDRYFLAIKSELSGTSQPLPSLTELRFLMARDTESSASYFACSSLRVDLAEPGQQPTWQEVLRRDGALAVKSYAGGNLSQASRIGEYQKDDEKMPTRPSIYPEFDPLHVTVTSLGTWAANSLDRDAAKRMFAAGKLYEAEYAENGDLIGRWEFGTESNGSFLQVTFQKATDYLPVTTRRRFRRGIDRSEAFAGSEPAGGTTTEWAKTARGVWLPERVLVTGVDLNGKVTKWALEYAWDFDEATIAKLPVKAAPDWRVAHFEVFEEFLEE